jgi:glycosyltransferase involved in cell wall biosynthesis
MLAVFDALLLDGPRSGVEVSVAETARALEQLAPGEVAFACRRGVVAAEPWLWGAQKMRAPAWAVGRAGRILAQQVWLPRAALRVAKVLHGPAYVLPLGWTGRAVLTVYDLIALVHPQWTKPANVLHYRAVVPRSVRRADVIVVPSQVVADEVATVLDVDSERIRVISLGVRDVFRQQPSERDVEEFRRRHGLEKPFFAVVGNIEPKKNIGGIVRGFEIAATRVPHELVIAGRKGWRCSRDLAAIAASPVKQRIRMIGGLTDDELLRLYHACTALVQWSIYEGFGLVPLEAMSCGAPVIISSGGALPETAGPAAQQVAVGDVLGLAEALVSLAEEEDMRRRLAEAGREWSRRFSWVNHAEAVLSIYRSLQ